MMTYQLPTGERVEINDDVARGASVVSYTLTSGRVVDAIRCQTNELQNLKADMNRLSVCIGQLLSERAHTIEVLTRFYRSELSLSSVSPLLDLARTLNPALDERPVR